MIHKNWAELIKPTQLDVKPGNDPLRQATVVAEPLERGFGLTLGNALRRVLLSSLQGAAITSVQIDNVLHEFSSVAGVREDVTDIVLNLKGIALRMDVEGPKRLSVNAKGPGVVTAADISECRDRSFEQRTRDLSPRRWCRSVHGTDREYRQGLRGRGQEQTRGRADWPDPRGCDLFAGCQGQLRCAAHP